MTERNLAEGLLTRLTLIEVLDDKPEDINESHKDAQIGEELLRELATLKNEVDKIEWLVDRTLDGKFRQVAFDRQALEEHRQYRQRDIRAFNKYKNSGQPHLAVLESRLTEQTMRVAALVAIGRDPLNPEIVESDYMWARAYVNQSSNVLRTRFASGELVMDDYEEQQFINFKKLLAKYSDYKYAHSEWDESYNRLYRVPARAC